MIKVLWLCNIVLPDFSQEFGIRKNIFGGWMTGMLHELEKTQEVDISLCFPIMDKSRLKNGRYNEHDYYTFLFDPYAITYDDRLTGDFRKILGESQPDLVHIWGTEYPHTTAMLLACKERGMLERTVIHIQGLVSVCEKHYMADIPEEYRKLECEQGISIEKERLEFQRRGKCETEGIKMASHVIGRTDWDRACVEMINPKVQYHFCGEILRDAFYENMGTWRYEQCRKYSIFVSQASYPIKGFHYLLQALPAICEKFPDTHVYVAGVNIAHSRVKSPYAVYLEGLMREYDVNERVSFLDRLDEGEMVEQYQQANVFVSAATVENSPNSLSEARMIGVPSVVSFVGGAYSRMEPGKDGFLYPHDEPALLAYYVCRIFENKNRICDEFSVRSSRKESLYSEKKHNAENNLNIYKDILYFSSNKQ